MGQKMRIMVVDDEKIVRESLFHWFEKGGHTVDMAASGEEALEMLEQSPFDLMFVDIKMPGMDGIQLLRKIKHENPDTEVIMITGHGDMDLAIKSKVPGD